MGVLQCDRENCTNIMSTYHFEGLGYLCRYCAEEFRTISSNQNSKNGFVVELAKFMNVDYYCNKSDLISVEEFLEENNRYYDAK